MIVGRLPTQFDIRITEIIDVGCDRHPVGFTFGLNKRTGNVSDIELVVVVVIVKQFLTDNYGGTNPELATILRPRRLKLTKCSLRPSVMPATS